MSSLAALTDLERKNDDSRALTRIYPGYRYTNGAVGWNHPFAAPLSFDGAENHHPINGADFICREVFMKLSRCKKENLHFF